MQAAPTTSDAPPRTLRAGSAHKRTAILAAARELFLAEGFERSSVDAVAARAGVSKRTVYDYYGDKRSLLMAVVDAAGRSLMETVHAAIAETLVDVVDLEPALVAFADRIVLATRRSSDYPVLLRLITTEGVHLPEVRDRWADAPEDALAEQFTDLGRRGLLEVPDPRRAADHYVALTVLPAVDALTLGASVGDTRVEQTVADGARAFLRAYRPQPGWGRPENADSMSSGTRVAARLRLSTTGAPVPGTGR